MCLEVVERVVKDDVLLTLFEIPEHLWPAMRQSWEKKKPDLMGRFDFAWDGINPPKLLEYNADTPSILVESGRTSMQWKKDVHPNDYQSNYMDMALNYGLKNITKGHYGKVGILAV